MARFATVEELETKLGRQIPEDKRGTAEAALDRATAEVQDMTHQLFEFVEDDVQQIHVDRADICRLNLPQRPVLDIASIKVDGVTVSGYRFNRYGKVTWPGGNFWGSYGDAVEVTYTHGYALSEDDIPEENPLGITLLENVFPGVKARVLQLAAQALANPGEVVSESMGSYSVAYEGGGEANDDDEELAETHRQMTI